MSQCKPIVRIDNGIWRPSEWAFAVDGYDTFKGYLDVDRSNF